MRLTYFVSAFNKAGDRRWTMSVEADRDSKALVEARNRHGPFPVGTTFTATALT